MWPGKKYRGINDPRSADSDRGVYKGYFGGCQLQFADKEDFPQTKFTDKEGFTRVPASMCTNGVLQICW